MKILFCNIGWMEFYKGQSTLDQIQGGGSYVKEKGMGHEVCNYAPYQGKLFGYVQPPSFKGRYNDAQIKIERLGAQLGSSISNILVVWTSKRPKVGTVIIGWYKNAKVYRHYQKFQDVGFFPDLHIKNDLTGYWIEAELKDATLLPIDERTFQIPRQVKGGMGQANIWYASDEESKELLEKVKSYIEKSKINVITNRFNKADPDKNAKVEKVAINKTVEYFENAQYTVKSVEKDNVGWDLEAVLGKEKLLIEVKGLSGSRSVVELTPNEYNALSSENQSYRLCVVHSALNNPTLLICRFSKELESWIVEGKENAIVNIKLRQSASIEINT